MTELLIIAFIALNFLILEMDTDAYRLMRKERSVFEVWRAEIKVNCFCLGTRIRHRNPWRDLSISVKKATDALARFGKAHRNTKLKKNNHAKR